MSESSVTKEPTGPKGTLMTEDDLIMRLPRTMNWPFAVKGKDFPAAEERLTRVLLGSDEATIQELKTKVDELEAMLNRQADEIRRLSSRMPTYS